MADAKLTALPAVTAAGANSLLYMVIDPSGAPLSRGITTSNLFFSRTLGSYGVTGLIGANNAATSTTQFDVSANIAVLRNPTDTPILIFSNTGTLTNNVLTAGPAANGRDQAGAFSANSWLHLYFIAKVDGSGLATLSSTVAPPTGPTLPSTYTHWSYCGAIRYNATPVLLPTRFAGSLATYGIATGGEIRILSAGKATTMTAVDASAYVPPNSRVGLFNLSIADNNIAATRYTLAVRPTGALDAGQDVATVISISGATTVATTVVLSPVGSNQNIDYDVLPASPLTSIGAFIDVYGYVMPNGGE